MLFREVRNKFIFVVFLNIFKYLKGCFRVGGIVEGGFRI